ncbi:S9 family peptidase [Actinopolymorpha pittospori]|uniref:Dipeptidyl aminopeptidase/acylaminoacyl peptidase n=1 Tax=Actinopolymorpha pittospori TaxID=648752 RepID=A0A927RBT9_9ACTN|nr:alpha/beta fold hydrolase [Actinopolymorpha pittospori]MBE1610502.1 dipeptidyl aminopeptidase/acylaminoacyl peptidase [Actinopolymorpha pittospori]
MTSETTGERAADDSSIEPATPFYDLDHYVALRRLAGLWLAPDGSRLVAAAQQLAPDRKKYVTSLWEIDPTGVDPARRLTRGATGEAGPAFLPDGSLLFVSRRPDAEAEDKKDDKPALWLLPAAGGEARQVAARPGGIAGVAVAATAGTTVVLAPTLPAAQTTEEDAELRKARSDGAVSAILHEGYPIRYWDHDLGPDELRLFAADVPAVEDGRLELRDLTPEPGRALDEGGYDVSADGTTVVSTWQVPTSGGDSREDLVAIDTASGERRTLASDPAYDFAAPRISPDGRWVVCVRDLRSTTEEPPDSTLWLIPLEGGQGRDLTSGLDLWPHEPRWAPDARTVYFTADELGHSPAFAVDVETGGVRRLTASGAYAALQPAPDGRSLYALRAGIESPLAAVRLAVHAVDQEPVVLRGPDAAPAVPGTVTEVTTTAADGSALRSWLVLPEGASATTPAPLLLWIHGGPLSSWNAWSWRWNPWLMVAQGYAVLLPDPALSTGYGRDFIQRGWGRWGAEPFTDLMAVTDEALRRDDIDTERVAAMGGSFGGYMANWVAGHTDRFRAIVTHASLWALDQFGPTTDAASYWFRELTPERALANSPHLSADRITTPMLVIHGDRDYRVPIGEGLRLWWELNRLHKGDPADLPHRFLYFPDENHWVLTPNHAKVWYQTVFAFLAWHVEGQVWERPELV